MVVGAILAGGIGSRMGNTEKPKQFLIVAGKPVIVHTVETFINCEEIDKVLVLCPSDWVDYTAELFEEYGLTAKDVTVISGGAARNDTIMNAIEYVEQNYEDAENVVMVTHDAVRPLVTDRIIKDNVRTVKEKGVCDTVIPATDTIVESTNSETITNVPDRAYLYQGQTPQSFRAGEFKELYNSLTEEEKRILTDAAKVFVIKGRDVFLVNGETFNIKITYQTDLKLAEVLLNSR